MGKIQETFGQLLNRHSTRFILALMVIILTFGYFYMDRVYGKTEREGNDMKIALVSILTIVLSYYFGASKASDDQKNVEHAATLAQAEVTMEKAGITVANFAALPPIGEPGKEYICSDTNDKYKWENGQYVKT